jgi:peptidoglycan hydrolase CwlO-like protein
MKVVWIASLAVAATTTAWAQSTIYKHVDESGRVTYSNKPMKGATVLELEPLTTVPGVPVAVAAPQKALATLDKIESPRVKESALPELKQAVAINTPTLASVEPQVQRRRDNDRRRILEDELQREEQSVTEVRGSITLEQQNPVLIAAVRTAQQAADPSPSQLSEMRNNIDKASGRIRGLQATVAEHEKNIEALKKELGALKP